MCEMSFLATKLRLAGGGNTSLKGNCLDAVLGNTNRMKMVGVSVKVKDVRGESAC